ncbi:hypothetical protein [Campylobacter ureolyticus]|nr:hypothetical protein [Campylobacter ureolyticus]MCZ6105740.1 hypothetical protein [Campylobacter ureolyticus]MCZ6158025.1 hypothetical protein [Campylobacter ureolyticus]GKH60828.1 hypothetical protein CE91St25_11640 [Campylobacter ureolyticus]
MNRVSEAKRILYIAEKIYLQSLSSKELEKLRKTWNFGSDLI